MLRMLVRRTFMALIPSIIWPRARGTSGVGLAVGELEGGAGPVEELAPDAEGDVDAGGAGVERFCAAFSCGFVAGSLCA